MKLISLIQACLLTQSEPVSSNQLAQACESTPALVEEALSVWEQELIASDSGWRLVTDRSEWQLVIAPEARVAVANLTERSVKAELTRPALETLTAIAYLSPVTKAELESLRGVNCALSLRNLMIRGLIKEAPAGELAIPHFSLTIEALTLLGLSAITDLPDYNEYHAERFMITGTISQP
ncbi:MAG: SMC-Scp complex subunit ScpB [Patescibacteria group bacterium]